MVEQRLKVYKGERLEPSTAGECRVTVNGRVLDPKPSQRIYNHSPDGFNWGYGGSGPAQLALAILLDYLGDAARARLHYQKFKWDIIAQLDPDKTWELTASEIESELSKLDAEYMRAGAGAPGAGPEAA